MKIKNHTWQWLKDIGKPVTVFRDSCGGCPLNLQCIRGKSIYSLTTDAFMLDLFVCPRCWCVLMVLHRYNTNKEQSNVYLCARLRDGIFLRGIKDSYKYEYPSREYVCAVFGYRDKRYSYLFNHKMTLIGCAGAYKHNTRKFEGYAVFRQWDPEHPRNLDAGRRRYLADKACRAWRDDSVEIDDTDCVHLMKKGPYGAIMR